LKKEKLKEKRRGIKEGLEKGRKEKEAALKKAQQEAQREKEAAVKKAQQEAQQKAQREQKIEIAKNMIAKGIDLETISSVTGLSIEDLSKI
jgi:predicted transposase/invertase (TIGR01784 family)